MYNVYVFRTVHRSLTKILARVLTIVTLQDTVDNRPGCIVVNINLLRIWAKHSVISELFWWFPWPSTRVLHGYHSSTFFDVHCHTTVRGNLFLVHGTTSHNHPNVVRLCVHLKKYIDHERFPNITNFIRSTPFFWHQSIIQNHDLEKKSYRHNVWKLVTIFKCFSAVHGIHHSEIFQFFVK